MFESLIVLCTKINFHRSQIKVQANLIIPRYDEMVLSNLEKTLLKCLILEKKFSIKSLSL